MAEWSKALASGASPQGRGFEPHSCHFRAPPEAAQEVLANACEREGGGANVRGSIVVSISACHAEDPGSIPGRGVWELRRFGVRASIQTRRRVRSSSILAGPKAFPQRSAAMLISMGVACV